MSLVDVSLPGNIHHESVVVASRGLGATACKLCPIKKKQIPTNPKQVYLNRALPAQTLVSATSTVSAGPGSA